MTQHLCSRLRREHTPGEIAAAMPVGSEAISGELPAGQEEIRHLRLWKLGDSGVLADDWLVVKHRDLRVLRDD